MGLISQTIANIKGGMSQQPDALRFPEQGALQVNGWSSETTGLQKRPPLIHVKKLANKGDFGTKPFIHFINRDEVEQYYVVLTGTKIRVFDLKGKEYEVRLGSSGSYIRSENPRDSFKLLTVADYTFICNNNIEVEGSNEVYLPSFNTKLDAIINVRGGQYGRTLKVIINGNTLAEYTIPDGSKPEHVKNTDAQFLAKELAQQIVSKGSGNFTAQVGQGFVYIVAQKGTNIESLSTEDGYADQLINPVTHYVQNFNKLPINAPNNYIVKIVGDASSNTKDEYYVKYDATRRVWKESLGWKTYVGLDQRTMPHALIRQAEGYFELKPLDWSKKVAGDDDTNPDPSFVGLPINDMFLYRNRLGFLSGENVILSSTGKYFNFYPASIAALSDDDPIDLAVSSDRISILKFAVPFNDELLMWSDESQFSLYSEGAFTAVNLNLNLVTSYDISDKARPYMIGRGVYYANPRSGHTSIYRYYSVRDSMNTKSSEDMTAYVPNLIPNGVFSIRGSTTENYCSVITSGDPNKIFIYKFFYTDEKLLQQSWSYWDLGKGTNVLAIDAIGSFMFPIIETEKHIYLTRLMFTQHTKDIDDEPYRLYMDSKIRYIVPKGKYDIDTNTTKLFPSDIYGTSGQVPFVYGKMIACTVRGRIYEFEPMEAQWTTKDALIFQGDLTNAVLFIGLAYEFKYQFSKFLIKQFDNLGKVKTVDTGRLQLRRAWINYETSGFFKVNVTNGSSTYTYRMTGIQLGERNATLGTLNISDGQFRFPCMGKAERVTVDLISDTPTPLSIIGCGWEGSYIRRTSSI